MAAALPAIHRLGTLALTLPVLHRSLSALEHEALSAPARRALNLAAASSALLALDAVHALPPGLRAVAVCVFVAACVGREAWERLFRDVEAWAMEVGEGAKKKMDMKKKVGMMEVAEEVSESEEEKDSSCSSDSLNIGERVISSPLSGSGSDRRDVSQELPSFGSLVGGEALLSDGSSVSAGGSPVPAEAEVKPEVKPVDIEYIPPRASSVGAHFVSEHKSRAMSVAEKARALDAWTDSQPKRMPAKTVHFGEEGSEGVCDGVSGKSFVYQSAAAGVQEEKEGDDAGMVRAPADVTSQFIDEGREGTLGVLEKIKAMEKYLDEAPKYRPEKAPMRRRMSTPVRGNTDLS